MVESSDKNLLAISMIAVFFALLLFAPTYSKLENKDLDIVTSVKQITSPLIHANGVNTDKFLAFSNKMVNILDFDEDGGISYTSEYSDGSIIEYFERALFYDNDGNRYIDIDYVDICSSNNDVNCAKAPSNEYLHGISVTSLANYAYLLFGRNIDLTTDFTYDGIDFMYAKDDTFVSNGISIDSYEVEEHNRIYDVILYGKKNDKYVAYTIAFEVIGAKDINEATFDNIRLISYSKYM